MKNYKHLSLGQRYQTESLFNIGLSQTKIADQLSVHRSTISRELKSNIPKRGIAAGLYIGEHAQVKTDKRHRDKTKRVYLSDALKKRIACLMTYKNAVQNLYRIVWRKNPRTA